MDMKKKSVLLDAVSEKSQETSDINVTDTKSLLVNPDLSKVFNAPAVDPWTESDASEGEPGQMEWSGLQNMPSGYDELLDTENFYISRQGKLYGKDADTIGGKFIWKGALSKDGRNFILEKRYMKGKHEPIFYWGDVLERQSKLKGYWGFKNDCTEGTFEMQKENFDEDY